MNRKELIALQIKTTHKQTLGMVADLDQKHWNTTPEVIDSNINWQLGHIALGNYLHGIASISGPNEKIRAAVNVQDMIKWYGPGSKPNELLDEKPTSEELIQLLELEHQVCMEELDKLSDEDLDAPTAVPNPAVKLKFQALLWLPKHVCWHIGQMAMLKRILNKEIKDYGIKLEESLGD